MSSLWSKAKWLVNVYKDISKSGFVLAKYGTQLTLGGLAVGSVAGISVGFTEAVPLIASIKFTYNDLSIVISLLSIAAVVAGLWLIYLSASVLKDRQPKVARVMVLGLPGVEENSFPDHLLSKTDLYLARIPIFLNQKENAENFALSITQQVERFNAEAKVDLLAKFVLHDGCTQLYFGGLARVPFLVAYGFLLRQCTAQVSYFDRSHSDEKRFMLLDDEDAAIELLFTGAVKPNQAGEVGIAVGLSLAVTPHQLPERLCGHTFVAECNVSPQRNVITNQANLERISRIVGAKVDELSAMAGVKTIHLFLSVQASLAIDIGRQYQEGTQKSWVIHNFDGKQYGWALLLDSNGLSLYQPN